MASKLQEMTAPLPAGIGEAQLEYYIQLSATQFKQKIQITGEYRRGLLRQGTHGLQGEAEIMSFVQFDREEMKAERNQAYRNKLKQSYKNDGVKVFRQQPQAEVHTGHQEKLIHQQDSELWNRLSRKAMETPSLEIFKTQVDEVTGDMTQIR